MTQNYFAVRHTIEKFSGIEITSTSKTSWRDIKWVRPIRKRRHHLPDISCYNGSYIYAKTHIADELTRVFPELTFIESFDFESEVYRVHIVPEIKNLIDFSGSKVEFFPEGNSFGLPTTQISKAVKLKFTRDVDEPLFCPSELINGAVYCGERFKNYVEEHNLSGPEFVPLNKLGVP